LLVVDDSDINRDVAKRILEQAGAVVTTSEDGTAALATLRRDPGAYQVALMDLQMPGIDGNETTRRIRAEAGLQHLIIIGLTAGALRSERQRALAAGMNDFITKPFEPRALIACIRKHLGMAEPARSAPVSQFVLRGVEAGAEPSELRLFPSIPGLDVREVAAQLDYDASEYALMVTRLLRDGAEIAAEVGEVTATSAVLTDSALRAELAGRAHKLRGSAGFLGAKELHMRASRLDEALVRGEPAAAIEPLVHQLLACWRELSAAVAPWIARQQTSAASAQIEGALTHGQLTRLVELLHDRDPAVLSLLSELAPGLRVALGDNGFEALLGALSKLDYTAAVALVEQVRAA
jgi:CheY-like chemotaxis protein